ncbi:MAG: FG-GAP-like repeat-containing protein [Planctomycetota bacterium]|jgi:hypothetical protein
MRIPVSLVAGFAVSLFWIPGFPGKAFGGDEPYRFRREIRLGPGETYAVGYDRKRKAFWEEEPGRGYAALGSAAREQILRAPGWLREDLADRLVDLVFDAIDVGENAAPTFYDVDGDGAKDLIVGCSENRLRCFLAPHFKEDPDRLKHIHTAGTGTPLFFDLEMDGKVELIVADGSGAVVAYKGEGWKEKEKIGRLGFTGLHFIGESEGSLVVSDAAGTVWRFQGQGAFFKVETPEKTPCFHASISVLTGHLRVRGTAEGTLTASCTVSGGEALVENLSRVKVSANARPVFHDLNRDGAPELLVGAADGTIRVYRNHGVSGAPWFATFSAEIRRRFDGDVGYLSSPRIADLNGDGALDMVSGTKEGAIRFYPGPAFREEKEVLKALRFEGVVVPAPGDFTGDGKMDLAVGLADGSIRFFAGPAFTEAPELAKGIKVETYAAPHAGDMDGDGKVDLVVGSGKGTLHFFRNTGAGFREVQGHFGALKPGEYPSPAVFDANADGAPDLVVGDRSGALRLYLAPGWAESEGALAVPKTEGFASPGIGDLNGDGKPELVVGSLEGIFVVYEREKDAWVEKDSWKFEPAMGLEKLTDYFLRVHPEAERLRGMTDGDTLKAYVDVLASAKGPLFDEVAFSVAAIPTEILRAMARVENADLLLENARSISTTASKLKYVEVVEKEDYTTLAYAMGGGRRVELPRDVYYWWVVHPRTYFEVPLRVDASYWEHDHDHYGITHEKWTRRKIELKEIGKGPKCRFWRSTLLEDRKYGKSLLEVAQPAKTFQEAVYLIGDWVSQKMPESWFTYGRKSADLQPNVIYQKNYGSCGEAAIFGAACARTLLIASGCAGCGGEDHIWTEFWYDGKWFPWDLCQPSSQIRYPWACCERAEHVGTQVLAVTRWRGDGRIEVRTTETEQPKGCGSTARGKGYTETGSLTLTVVDADGEPVEGAAVVVRSNCRNYWRTAVWGYTDPEGMCRFQLGRPHRKCMIDVISKQGVTGISNFPLKENREYEVRIEVHGSFRRTRVALQKALSPSKREPGKGTLTATVRILREEQRPRNLSTARRPRKETTEFAKKTGYLGTRGYPHPNPVPRGIVLCRLPRPAFEQFQRSGVLPQGWRLVEGSLSWPFDPNGDEVLLFVNPNRYTHVRFETELTAVLPAASPEIRLTEKPERARSGEKVTFAGSAADNLHVAALEVSLDDGTTWADITEALDRGTGRFRYTWDTGKGGPAPTGVYPVRFRVRDGAGTEQQTDPMKITLEPSRIFLRQVIYQDNPDSPLPRSSWVLGPFEVVGNERFLGITSDSKDPEFDMDLFLFFDKNGNRKLDGMGEQKAKSTTPTPVEKVVVNNPPKGVYWIYCQGWQVKERKDLPQEGEKASALSPGRFLTLKHEDFRKKRTFAYLDLSLSFDIRPVFIIDVGPVKTAPMDDIVVRGAFLPGIPVAPGSVKITVNGRDRTGEANLGKEGFTLKLADVERDQEVAVTVEARSLTGCSDRVAWRFKAVHQPVKVLARPTPGETHVILAVHARGDRRLEGARARFWRKGQKDKGEWQTLVCTEDGTKAEARASLLGRGRGAFQVEVEYRMPGSAPETASSSFRVAKGVSKPKVVAVYPRNGTKVYDFRPPLSGMIIGAVKHHVVSLQLILDGVDLTDESRVFEGVIKHFPAADLAKGEHTLECIAKLKDGSTLSGKSTFTVLVMGETKGK